jgi:hypothetical protein
MVSINLLGQMEEVLTEGSVSYITSQSIYVKFASTENIQPGDTLYIKQNGNFIPALQVKNKSSLSCVCEPLLPMEFKTSDVILSKQKAVALTTPVVAKEKSDTLQAAAEQTDTLLAAADEIKYEQEIRGRVSISSYSNFSNSGVPDKQRMRYTFSFNGNHLGNSRMSAETYLSFVHSNTNWEEIQDNMFNGLKVYNLAVKYDFSGSTRMWLGRKINPTITNVGAIDGLQFEKNFGAFTAGAFAGSRPDYEDYSFNFSLVQYGAYFGHEYKQEKGQMQSSIAFIEQNNSGYTDRRFLYFQHSNSLLSNLFFFGTAEMDLYQKVDEKEENTFNLTNLYLSLRYRILKQLSVSASYSARNNIIYYQTYKDFIDRLLESETMQGWRLQLNYRPIRNLSVGLSGGYRHRKPDPKPSTNLYGYVTYSRVPGINAAITLSATVLETSYLNGNIYSLGMSRDLIPGILSGGFNYRMVDYHYTSAEIDLPQHIADVNLNWRIYKKLSLSLNYEGTFEKENNYNRIYVNLSQRF